MCLRYVDPELEVQECFVGLYAVPSKTAAIMFSVMKDTLQRLGLDLSDVRGQCYDGASNMSGKYQGVQALVKKEEPRALFVHCTAHRLNLVVQDTVDEVPTVRDAVHAASDIIEFFRASNNRELALESFGAESTLRPLCPTRWTCREPSLSSLLRNYEAARDALEAIEADRDNSGKIRSTASGHARCMGGFDFLFGVMLCLRLLQMTTPVMTAVQGEKQTLAANLMLLKSLKIAVAGQREQFSSFYAEVLKKAEKLGVDPPRLRRQKRLPRRLDDGGEAYQPSTPEEQHRVCFLEAVDRLHGALQTRYSCGTADEEVTDEQRVAQAESALLRAETEDIRATARFYGMDEDQLSLHCKMLVDVCSRQGINITTISEAAAALKEPSLAQLVPRCIELLRLILTVPATSCTAERSFIELRRLKTWLRTSSTQERLNHTAVCSVHAERLQSLDRQTLMKEFASRTPQRQNAFDC